MIRILVAEDDPSTNKLLCAVLRRAGWEPLVAHDGLEALDLFDSNYIDLLVTDIMMPHMDGYELCRNLRSAGYDLPILMLTAKQQQPDKVNGFVAGTDDYLTKPVDMQELVLRIKALLRRAKISDGHKIVAGAAVFDANDHTACRGAETIALPTKEFELIYKLLSNPNKVYTRMQLLDEIWGWNTESAEATVNVHINRLRTRFKNWPDFEIQTVRGLGYRAVIHHDR